ncbi:nucleotide exchange factor GrpE [Brachybacterium fresconis]|uniref:Molecular chaperone GrpE (Heat shock protein) n=1 Tax=Brachybacterium fresconis TaxID=173363 RepID=A0ABS4YKY8_9MICO|nr:nucleotide exchange factor GrpE [Brachybacterium fresconis]MBP2409409.1 molecular chaperone GrpE (heat shock protein) [Brachybacterium fresconis]
MDEIPASAPFTDEREPNEERPVVPTDVEEAHEAPAADTVEREALRALEDQLGLLREDFSRRAAEYEGTVRALQSTVEELRAQQLTGLMKPVFQRFADLKAEIDAAASRARERSDWNNADEYEFFSGSVDAILDHFDLESVRALAGDPFDRHSHAAVLRKPTDDPELDQTIARVARQGFRVIGGSRVLIPARVVIWSFSSPPNAPTAEASQIGHTSG